MQPYELFLPLPLLVFPMNLRTAFPRIGLNPGAICVKCSFGEISYPRLSGSQGSMDGPATLERVSLLLFTVDERLQAHLCMA